MTNNHFDLDDSVREYFEFSVKGHKYRFNHMTTDEVEELKKLGDDDVKTKELLFKFISKVDPKSPSFKEISKKMIVPHWVNFRKMIETEFGR